MAGMFRRLTVFIVFLMTVPFNNPMPTIRDMNGKSYPLLDGHVVAEYDRLSPSVAQTLKEQAPKQPEIEEEREPATGAADEEAKPHPEEVADDKLIFNGLMAHTVKILEDKLEITQAMTEVSQESMSGQLIIERLMKQ